MKLISLTISLITLTQISQFSASQAADDSFTVFCTGNHDSTGSCLEVSSSEEHKELNCIMVPGNIIDCKNEANERIECILIAATSAQAEFSCNKNTEGTFAPEAKTIIEIPASQIIDEIETETQGKGKVEESLDITQTIDDNDENVGANQTSIFNNPFEEQ